MRAGDKVKSNTSATDCLRLETGSHLPGYMQHLMLTNQRFLISDHCHIFSYDRLLPCAIPIESCQDNPNVWSRQSGQRK